MPRIRERSITTTKLWNSRFTDLLKLKSSIPIVPNVERKLIPKRMHDSYVEEFLLFGTDKEGVREDYINFYGGIR